MKNTSMNKYHVLLEKMTPLYTLITVTAKNEEDATEQALEQVVEFSHDRLPSEGIWSVVPQVDIFSPTEDGEPSVIDISDAGWDVED